MTSSRDQAADLRQVMQRSARWLLAHRDPKSGGWPDLPGKPASTLNTAEVLLALVDGGADVVAVGAQPVREAVAFLLRHQLQEGDDRGAWPRSGAGGPEPDLIRTSFALQALIRTGMGVDQEPVRMAVDWLQGVRNGDRGWGFRRGEPSALMPTCFALLALIESCKGGLPECRESIEAGLDLLVTSFRNGDGSFGVSGRLAAPHTIYAAMVLQEARQQQLSRYPDREREALDWLLQHPDEAKRLVEEEFPLGGGAYGFLYMTDSLLLRVLAASQEKRHRRSSLAEEALNSVKDKMQEDGGFYGYRTFSWSTAKVVSGLQAAHFEYPRFPSRSPEYPGLRVGHVVVGFAVLAAAAMVYLTSIDRFGLLHVLFFVFVFLVLLVAYGRIGQETFKSLTERLLDKLPGGKTE